MLPKCLNLLTGQSAHIHNIGPEVPCDDCCIFKEPSSVRLMKYDINHMFSIEYRIRRFRSCPGVWLRYNLNLVFVIVLHESRLQTLMTRLKGVMFVIKKKLRRQLHCHGDINLRPSYLHSGTFARENSRPWKFTRGEYSPGGIYAQEIYFSRSSVIGRKFSIKNIRETKEKNRIFWDFYPPHLPLAWFTW